MTVEEMRAWGSGAEGTRDFEIQSALREERSPEGDAVEDTVFEAVRSRLEEVDTFMKHCVAKVAPKKGKNAAFAICKATGNKAGYFEKGSTKLTRKGKKKGRSKAQQPNNDQAKADYEKAIDRKKPKEEAAQPVLPENDMDEAFNSELRDLMYRSQSIGGAQGKALMMVINAIAQNKWSRAKEFFSRLTLKHKKAFSLSMRAQLAEEGPMRSGAVAVSTKLPKDQYLCPITGKVRKRKLKLRMKLRRKDAVVESGELASKISALKVGDQVQVTVKSRARSGAVTLRKVKSEVLGVRKDYHGRPFFTMKARARGGAQLGIPLGTGGGVYMWTQGNATRPIKDLTVLHSEDALERHKTKPSKKEKDDAFDPSAGIPRPNEFNTWHPGTLLAQIREKLA